MPSQRHPLSSTSGGVSLARLLQDEKNFGAAARIGFERISLGYEKQEGYISLLLRNTVLGDPEVGGKKSSHSIIVYGIPGAGKTTVVESVLTRMSKDPKFHKGRKIVRLSGLLCTDFKSAVDEICWQLSFKPPFEEEEEGNDEGKNHDEDIEIREDLERAKSFEDRLEYMIQFLKTNMAKMDHSIIFVLDKLDLFAEHANQHLLYNLYDLVANSKETVPICVVGITDRVDVLELFEKRVKSRFSHRNVNICPVDDFPKYAEIVTRLLRFKEDSDKKMMKRKREWNDHVTKIIGNNDIQKILRSVFDADPTISQLDIYLFTLLNLANASNELSLSHFQQSFESCVCKNDIIKMTLDLPVTDLIAMLSIFKHMQTNKQQAWQPSNLYRIVDKVLLSLGMGKEDFLRSIRKLETLRFIIPLSTTHRKLGAVNNLGEVHYKTELTIPEFLEIWRKYPQLPSSFKEFL